jgi:hypothetical protein
VTSIDPNDRKHQNGQSKKKGDLKMPNLLSDSNDPNVAAVGGDLWSPPSPHREKLIQLQSELEDLMLPTTPQFVLDRLRALHADISRELGQYPPK